MAQDYEDIESTTVDGAAPFDEPDGLFPEDGTELVATATGGAIQVKKDVAVLRNLAKTPIVSVALARLGLWRPTATALAAKMAAKTYDDISTSKGMAAAISDRAALRDPRLKAQRIVKATKTELRAVSTSLEAELAEIVKVLGPQEERVGQVIKAEEERKEAEREKAREAEANRQRAHEEQIAKIRTFAERGQTADMEGVTRLYDAIAVLTIGDSWEEYRERAQVALDETLGALRRRMSDLREQAAEAAQRKLQEEVERDRRAALDAAQAQLSEQQRAIERQQQAFEIMTGWSQLPGKFPTAGETAVEVFADVVDELIDQAPDAPTFGAMLPVALLAHSTALAHARALLAAAMERDMQAPVPAPPPEPAATETTWAPTPAPTPAPVVQEAARAIVQASKTAFQAQTVEDAVNRSLSVDHKLEAIDDQGPAADVDPATAVLNMGAINERLGFVLTRAFVEDKLEIPARREDRRAAFWTEDDYLLIAARIAIRMEHIVAAAMNGTEA